MPTAPRPLTRAAIGLMLAPAILFSVMPALVRALGSLALLFVPAVFALHGVGLWLIRQGRSRAAIRRAWQTWTIGLVLGIAMVVSTLLIGIPTDIAAREAWGSAGTPGLAWLVVYPLVPSVAIGATVQATWPFADRRERVILSWAMVGTAATLAMLLVLRAVAPTGVSGPVGILVALGVSGPVLLAGVGRMLWRTAARNRAAPSRGPVSTVERV